jgi:hypothetical protein
MIETLSPEQTKAALALLIEDGKLELEDLAEAVKRCPTVEMKRMVDVVHGAMCKASHDTEDEGVKPECEYHHEDQVPNCWNQYDHQQWLDRTAELLGEIDVANEKELLNAFQTVNVGLTKIDQMKGARKLLELLLA